MNMKFKGLTKHRAKPIKNKLFIHFLLRLETANMSGCFFFAFTTRFSQYLVRGNLKRINLRKLICSCLARSLVDWEILSLKAQTQGALIFTLKRICIPTICNQSADVLKNEPPLPFPYFLFTDLPSLALSLFISLYINACTYWKSIFCRNHISSSGFVYSFIYIVRYIIL